MLWGSKQLLKAAPCSLGQVAVELDNLGFIPSFSQPDDFGLIIALSQMSFVQWGLEALPCPAAPTTGL